MEDKQWCVLLGWICTNQLGWTGVQGAGTAAAAVFAAVAAGFAWRGIVSAQKASRAATVNNILYQLTSAFAAKEMRVHFDALRMKEYCKLREKANVERSDNDVVQAYENVGAYYSVVWRMNEAGLIDDGMARNLTIETTGYKRWAAFAQEQSWRGETKWVAPMLGKFPAFPAEAGVIRPTWAGAYLTYFELPVWQRAGLAVLAAAELLLIGFLYGRLAGHG